jgi:putative nucleotidyltransferase with HDIG domain
MSLATPTAPAPRRPHSLPRRGPPPSVRPPRSRDSLRPPTVDAPLAGRDLGLVRYLPGVVAVTTVLVAGPVLLARALFPGTGLRADLLATLAVIAGSLLLSAAGAEVWKRLPGARDVVFSELMLWSWLRRYVADRRARRARELIASSPSRRQALAELVRLSRLMGANDPYLRGHTRRVARHAVRIARRMGLPHELVSRIRTAAELHDIGKMHTPREILHNPSRLTDAEYAVIKLHAARGAEMLEGVADPQIVSMVRHHHERVDGSGYPEGLAGEDIPLGARVIAVADTYDAITSARPYRRAATHKRAIAILTAESGTRLDAAAVTAFLVAYSGRRQLAAWSFIGVSLERAAYALKALVGSPVLPAIGATAVLAAGPALTHHAGKQAPGTGAGYIYRAQTGPAAGSLPLPTDAAAPGSDAAAPQDSRRERPSAARRGPIASIPSPSSSGDVSVRTEAAPAGAQTSSTSPPQAPSGQPATTPSGGEAGSTRTPVTAPATPEVSVSKITVPSVSVAATPAVSTPVLTIASVTVPTPSTPVVSVPTVTVAPARLP